MINCILVGCVCLFLGSIVTYLIMKSKAEKNIEELALLKGKINAQEDFRTMIKEDFSKLAADTINTQQEDLRKQNREFLDEKMKPLSEKLKEFQDKVTDFHRSNEVSKTEIIKEIEHLKNNSSKLSEDAQKLTQALTMSQNVKGSYGEDLLEVILQSGGLKENINYTKQYNTTSVSSKDETVHKIKPDFVVKLPNEKHLVIDSKFTLASYLEYCDNKNPQTKKAFKQSVEARIKDLSDKNYENAQNLSQPDFILLFMPIENCISMIYSDPDFQETLKYAYDSNIIIVGSASMLTVVRLVNNLWAVQIQCDNSNKIALAGITLYETCVAFCKNLEDLQKRFEDVSALFVTTINRFKRNSPKNPSMFSQIEVLKREYKLSTTKQIPNEFLEETADEEMSQVQ